MNAPMDDIVNRLRVPPNSVEAEQSVLGGLLIDNLAWQAVGDLLKASDFYQHEHAQIFAAIGRQLEAQKPADVITIFEDMRHVRGAEEFGGLAYLNSLAQCVPSATNIRRYAEIVREHSLERRLISIVGDALDTAWGDGSVADKIDRIQGGISALDLHRIRRGPQHMRELAASRLDYYSDLADGRIQPGWSTGNRRLDEVLNGLAAGGLYILGARPKVGKTAFGLSIAQHCAENGLPTLILQMEMPAAQVFDRSVVQAGRVNHSSLMRGKLDHDGWGRLVQGVDRVKAMPVYIDDEPELTISQVRAKARQVKGLKVLVVDYLQLCGGSGDDNSKFRQAPNRNADIERFSRGLKALAKTDGIAVIALSQLNRSVETRQSKRPMLSDLRDSGSIEQDADAVIFMWPVRDLPDQGRKVIGMSVEANRHGPTTAFAMEFDGAHQTWHESAASIDSRGEQPTRQGFE